MPWRCWVSELGYWLMQVNRLQIILTENQLDELGNHESLFCLLRMAPKRWIFHVRPYEVEGLFRNCEGTSPCMYWVSTSAKLLSNSMAMAPLWYDAYSESVWKGRISIQYRIEPTIRIKTNKNISNTLFGGQNHFCAPKKKITIFKNLRTWFYSNLISFQSYSYGRYPRKQKWRNRLYVPYKHCTHVV